ncbi:PREDICTED: ribonuclease 4-like [Bison bison bison]|uniref:Ribonuclease 4-like n=1 Tax=Bison bison bison TaxID=43346 RepID=A0A6P3HEF4_BISBB|nr:PREDICTED: ribonuclease 4-like [Bison bison bison]
MNLTWTLLLLLLLELTVFASGLPFSRRHIDNPRSWVPGGQHRYCDVMMRRRWLIHRGRCKQINTFIHEDLATIADFCTTPAVPCTSSGSLLSCHNSSHDVSVTDCFAKAGTRPPYCHYQKKDSIRPICVGCKNGAPVHLDS